jgi:threonylcarbamoyladenosine tRNA methylthiotransferase MtaB
MKRRWGTKRFVDRCRQVSETLDKPAFTTDVILGFPGETDADFEATCDTAREVGFSKIHAFPFSPRRGTPAAELSDMVPKRIKSERGKHLANIERELRAQYFGGLLQSKLRVLVESVSEQSPERMVGTSCRYAPVEFVARQAKGGEMDTLDSGARSGSLQGTLVSVTPTKLVDGVLKGAIDLDAGSGMA